MRPVAKGVKRGRRWRGHSSSVEIRTLVLKGDTVSTPPYRLRRSCDNISKTLEISKALQQAPARSEEVSHRGPSRAVRNRLEQLMRKGGLNMKIVSLQLKGFRCFSPEGQTIRLDGMTCFVGPNASGKTAAMMALVRMFGERQADRSVTKGDFHIPPGEELASQSERKLSIEVRLEFPQLADEILGTPQGEGAADGPSVPIPNGHTANKAADSIPEFFNQMIVDAPGEAPYCRIRLEARWTDDGTPDGDIEQRLYWITTPHEPEEKDKLPMRAGQRARIRVIYASAKRDAAREVQPRGGGVLGNLLKAINQETHRKEIEELVGQLERKLSGLPGLRVINEQIQNLWSEFYDGPVARNVSLSPLSEDASRVLGGIQPVFQPDEQGGKLAIADLSDGLRALFALSLPLGVHQVVEKIRRSANDQGFVNTVLDTVPFLTIFAVEEPENHLSPHYLGKIVKQLKETAEGENVQVLLSSHSASLMRRVQPNHVRYFLGGETRAATRVLEIPLPEEDDEVYKYVREAVRGYPELYFSRLVVLGEGPSEEIVLPRLFEASGSPLDGAFICVVPLGGRHVNHFWKLLNRLSIPHVTLLDLDEGREGGGRARIDYIAQQLEKFHGPAVRDELRLTPASEKGSADNRAEVLAVLREKYNVFFLEPLDLDFAMLKAFPEAYINQAPPDGGPRIPKIEPERARVMKQRVRQVLGIDEDEDISDSYSPDTYHLFPWYKYLFLDRSKPVAHTKALIALEEQPGWLAQVPETLSALVEKVRTILLSETGDRP